MMVPRFDSPFPGPFPIRKNVRPFRIYSARNRTMGLAFFTERDQDKQIVGGPYASISAAMNHLRKFVLHV